MSIRYLYEAIPRSKRLCSYYRCQLPILRNIDRDEDGRIYHHGCLMAAQDERHRCLDCGHVFNGTKVALGMHLGLPTAFCPSCGSCNLKPPWRREPKIFFPHGESVHRWPDSYDPFREPWSGS